MGGPSKTAQPDERLHVQDRSMAMKVSHCFWTLRPMALLGGDHNRSAYERKQVTYISLGVVVPHDRYEYAWRDI